MDEPIRPRAGTILSIEGDTATVRVGPREASVTINGVELTPAQVTTLRVALTQWHGDLAADVDMVKALGPIGPMYLDRGREVLRMLLEGRRG